MDSIPTVPPERQAEAEAYETEYNLIKDTLEKLHVRRDHNRDRGRAIIKWMVDNRINTLQVGSVILRPQPDQRGFQRFHLGSQGEYPHARR